MQKRNVLTVCCTFVVVLLLCMTLFACDKNDDSQKHELNLNEGTYPDALPSNFQGDEKSVIDKGLQTGASVDEVRQAVFAMYNVANRSRKSADTSLMIQYTDGGQLQYRGFELKSGDSWYYQLPTQALGIYDLMEQGNTLLAYTSDSNVFYFVRLGANSAPKCEGISNFPYAEFLMTEKPTAYSFEEFKEKRFFLDDQLELCNMKFSLDIIDDTSKISYDAEKHVYTVELVVDVEQDKEKLAEWYQQAFNEGNKYSPVQVGERFYEYWNAKIEIWENGYVKFLRYDEKWTSDKEILGIKIGSESSSEFKFFYDQDEILTLLKQDPKYAKLSEEEQAELLTPADFIGMYSGAEIQNAALKSWEITLIVIGCVLFAVIVVVVGVEVAVKKGRLPKLAAKREAAKQKRIEKRNKKKGISSDEVHAEQNGDDDLSAFEQEQTDDVQNDNQSESDSFDENNE